eukprot:CAMPEP_0198303906 /NCGR_PEP_ID=MMETSP1449-20131203/57126_1 /TAXON_ID=420275 /ORGANISM="Attheya septentrionalis, Strain CCMP2084" /LENGTH=520 /DNA_ID=CAMNT_0044006413 /DNA_START=1190 /DNA_END=2752 /DNA_ORIENTATION=-
MLQVLLLPVLLTLTVLDLSVAFTFTQPTIWKHHATTTKSIPFTLLEAKQQKKKKTKKTKVISGLGFAKGSPKWMGCESLRTWLSERGADVNNISVGVVDSTTGLRGVTAARDLNEGDVIFSIPRESCIFDEGRADQSPIAAAIYPSAQERDALPACVRVALYLLWLERMPLEKAQWEPLLAALPTPQDFELDGGPMELWSETEIEQVECGQLISEVKSRAVDLREHYEKRVLPRWLQETDNNVDGALLSGVDVPSFQEFRHLVCVVTSRAYGEGEAGGGTSSMLVPGVDLCNHADMTRQNTKHALAPWGDFVVYAAESIGAGEEVFMTYGPFPNRLLLAQFGFLLPDQLLSDTALVRLDGLFPSLEDADNNDNDNDNDNDDEYPGGYQPATVQSEAAAEALWVAGPGPTALSRLREARRKTSTGRIARWQTASVGLAAIEALADPSWESGGQEMTHQFRELLERELTAHSKSAEEDAIELAGHRQLPSLPPREELALRFRIQSRLLLMKEVESLDVGVKQ